MFVSGHSPGRSGLLGLPMDSTRPWTHAGVKRKPEFSGRPPCLEEEILPQFESKPGCTCDSAVRGFGRPPEELRPACWSIRDSAAWPQLFQRKIRAESEQSQAEPQHLPDPVPRARVFSSPKRACRSAQSEGRKELSDERPANSPVNLTVAVGRYAPSGPRRLLAVR